MPKPDTVVFVKYEWDEPEKRMHGIPTRLCSSMYEAEDVLREASQEHDIYNIEVYALEVDPDAWEAYNWVPPSGGGLVRSE